MTLPLAAFALILAAAAGPAGARGTILFAGEGWAAIDRGGACEAAARAVRASPKGRAHALARFSFTPEGRRWGEFSARLSRDSRPGSSVVARIGAQRFLLVGRGGSAWSRGAVQEQALIAAVRGGGTLRIDARDGAGRRFTDHFELAGGATAIDAAAAACAGKKPRV